VTLVRCAATLQSGRPCQREASPPAQLCRFHAQVAARREDRGFYARTLSNSDQRGLASAAELEGVDAEIAVLRILIRRVLTLGDVDAARRGIDSLCRTLKVRHALDDRSADQLATSVERVLDSLGGELGVPL
jgi:hypothetical protein